MNRKNIIASIILISLMVILSIVGIYWAKPRISQADSNVEPILQAIPTKYVDNMEKLWQDYREYHISQDTVIQILLLYHVQNEGMFLPLVDTDTYTDKYFVHKKTHEELEAQKS